MEGVPRHQENSMLQENHRCRNANNGVVSRCSESTVKHILRTPSPALSDADNLSDAEATRTTDTVSGSMPPPPQTPARQEKEIINIEGASRTYTLLEEIGRGAYGRVYLADVKHQQSQSMPQQQLAESATCSPSLSNDLLTNTGSKGNNALPSTSYQVARVVLKRMDNGSVEDGLQAATLREIMTLNEVCPGSNSFDRSERDAFRCGRAVFRPNASSSWTSRRQDNFLHSCTDQSRTSLDAAAEDEWDDMVSSSPGVPDDFCFDSPSAQQRRHIIRGRRHLIRIGETLLRPREALVYVAMEYCEGGDLWHFMRDLKISLRSSSKKFGDVMPKQVFRRWAVELILALSHLHSRNIAHRDLKPQNIMLAKRTVATMPSLGSAAESPANIDSCDTHHSLPGLLYSLKIGDFGLSRLEGIPYKKYVHEAITLWYRSPDVLLGNTNYTYSADAWSMGCILVEMASGSVLFKGKDEADELRHIFTRGCRPSPLTFPHMRSYSHSERYAELLNKYQERDAENLTAEELTQMQVERISRHLRAFLRERNSLELLGDEGVDFLARLLILDPERRLTILEAMHHRFFTTAYAEVYGVDSLV